MKKLLFIAAILGIFACSAPKHDGYIITGTITGDSVKTGKVYLTNFSRLETIQDTADLVDGKFEFKGKVKTPESYSITIEGINGRINLFLDNSEITITAAANDMANAVVTGGVTNDLVTALRKQHEDITTKYGLDSLSKEYYKETTTPQRKEEIAAIFEKSELENKAIDSAFFAQNPTSFYTLNQMVNKVEDFTIEVAEKNLAAFKALPEFAENRNIKLLEEAIEVVKKLQPGMKAPDFTLNDPDGKPVSLSSVYSQNKVTMIDFWAGWCGPCRRFNPTLVKIYKDFNKKGFGIIGVSLDKEAEGWKKAIQDDKLTWAQVSDLKYWDSEAAKMYNVRYIPQNVFVDQNGIILKRKLNEEEIVPFLTETLK
ncbi:Thiol-disulfide oxidoreductase ResA [bioreactor metagenome]|uniref:Thiol-disulfide oxidoreductase ResA n=1 Tax=bioreactor metagenome TaxID=1076179 RepID=A0A644ZM48_9ZZZZ